MQVYGLSHRYRLQDSATSFRVESAAKRIWLLGGARPPRDGLFLPQLLTFPSPPLETDNRQQSSILPAENKQRASTKAPLIHSAGCKKCMKCSDYDCNGRWHGLIVLNVTLSDQSGFLLFSGRSAILQTDISLKRALIFKELRGFEKGNVSSHGAKLKYVLKIIQMQLLCATSGRHSVFKWVCLTSL